MRSFKIMLSAAAIGALLVPGLAAADPGNGKGGGNGKAAASHGNGGGKVKAAASHGNSGHGAKPVKATGTAKMSVNGNGATRAIEANGKSASRRVVREVRADDFFNRNDEAVIRTYYGNSASCPPGLAAKNNGCLPPGQAKKTYGVGRILPADLTLTPLPSGLLGRLPVAPSGYYYGRYNGDVYLIESSTRRIVDNILLSLLR